MLLALAIAAAACSPAKPPSVVLISVDTLRADALGAYGGLLPTPSFDRFAREGVLFEKAFAPAPATAPSHATLFTGQQVQRHGVLRNGESLPEAATTLAEAFGAHGYATAGFVSSFVLDPRFGWGQGFAHFDATLPENSSTMGKQKPYPGAFWTEQRFAGFDRRATLTTEAAIEWMEKAPEPFFLFVHYFDPHAPYAPPKTFGERSAALRFPLEGRAVAGLAPAQLERLVQLYHGEVLYVDDALAALLDAVARRSHDEALVVLTADHGEGLGQHGWLEHATQLYDEQIRVPLLVRWPGRVPAGRRIATPVELADVAPTLLELAGVASPAPCDGRSLAAAIRDGAELPLATDLRNPQPAGRGHRLGPRREALGPHRSLEVHLRERGAAGTLRSRRRSGRAARPCSPQNADRAAELRGLLEKHVAELPRVHDSAPLSDETRRALQALGYLE